MNNRESPTWHLHFLKAILEPVESSHLSQLVRDAETAIAHRLQELRVSATGSAEREAMNEAFLSLRYLRNQGLMHSSGSKNTSARAS
jgi:hypothetical protein